MSNNSIMVQDRAILTMTNQQKVISGLSNSATERPQTQVSRSRHYLMLNILETVRDTYIQLIVWAIREAHLAKLPPTQHKLYALALSFYLLTLFVLIMQMNYANLVICLLPTRTCRAMEWWDWSSNTIVLLGLPDLCVPNDSSPMKNYTPVKFMLAAGT